MKIKVKRVRRDTVNKFLDILLAKFSEGGSPFCDNEKIKLAKGILTYLPLLISNV